MMAFEEYKGGDVILLWRVILGREERYWPFKKKTMHYTRFNYEVGYVTLLCGEYGSILIFLLKFQSLLLYQCLINLFIFLSSAQGLEVGCYYRPV